MRRLIAATTATTLLITIGQAAAAGGLASSPAIVEHVAAKGPVGSLALSNSSSSPLKITVTARPWIQSHSGVVTPDRHHNLSKYVVPSSKSFTLPAGSNRSVTLTMLKVPGAKSLYGALEVVGLPTVKKHNGITAGYRLVGSLRLNPHVAGAKYKLTVGRAIVSHRALSIAVRNSGNTANPISGDVTITGPSGARNADIAMKRIIPGAIVYLPLGSLKSLPKGTYKVAVDLKQAGKSIAHTTRSFKI